MKWTDGESFTADDVAFTFNMLKEYPVLDLAGVWQYIDSVEATSDNQVTFTFNQPGASAFHADQRRRDRARAHLVEGRRPHDVHQREDPVGTGPMKVKSFNPRELIIERNPDYWQADEVKVEEIQFNKADAGGQVEQLKLSRGEYDQQGLYIPDIEKSYVSRDPEAPPLLVRARRLISVYMNLTKAPVRRRRVPARADHGVRPREVVERHSSATSSRPARPASCPRPGGVAAARASRTRARIRYDPEAADQALTDAGYEDDSEGQRLGKNGNPISFSFKVPGAYVDWVAASDILIENLQELGLQVAQETPAPASTTRPARPATTT